MLRKLTLAVSAAALALTVASGAAEARQRYADCGNNSRNDETAGAIAGAIIGGVVGNQVFRGERGLGTVAGVVLGGYAGSRLARSNDDCDQYYASNAYHDAFESDSYDRVSWRNPRSGNYGYVEPADDYRDRRGRECRNFEQEIYIDGDRETADGVACRQSDGTWKIIE